MQALPKPARCLGCCSAAPGSWGAEPCLPLRRAWMWFLGPLWPVPWVCVARATTWQHHCSLEIETGWVWLSRSESAPVVHSSARTGAAPSRGSAMLLQLTGTWIPQGPLPGHLTGGWPLSCSFASSEGHESHGTGRPEKVPPPLSRALCSPRVPRGSALPGPHALSSCCWCTSPRPPASSAVKQHAHLGMKLCFCFSWANASVGDFWVI